MKERKQSQKGGREERWMMCDGEGEGAPLEEAMEVSMKCEKSERVRAGRGSERERVLAMGARGRKVGLCGMMMERGRCMCG